MKTVSSGAQVIGGNPTPPAASSIANSPLNFEGPLTKRLLMTFPTGMLLQSNVCIATAHVSFGLGASDVIPCQADRGDDGGAYCRSAGVPGALLILPSYLPLHLAHCRSVGKCKAKVIHTVLDHFVPAPRYGGSKARHSTPKHNCAAWLERPGLRAGCPRYMGCGACCNNPREGESAAFHTLEQQHEPNGN